MVSQTATDAPQAVPSAEHHIAFIHILRGVAALVVVWSHLSGFWLYLTESTSALQAAWLEWIAVPFHVFENGGHLGVVIFFLISGYIITHTSLREDRISYVIKRVFRIMPALFVALLVTWALMRLMASLDLPMRSFPGGPAMDWLKAVFLLDGFTTDHFMLPTTWTLVVELIFYALVFCVMGTQRLRPLASTWVMSGIWVVACLVSTNASLIASHPSGQMIYLVGFLLIGRLIYLAHVKLVDVADSIVLGAAVFLVIVLLLDAREPGYLLAPGGWRGFEPLTAYLTALLIFMAMLRLAPRSAVQPFAFLGDISYSLYLLHLPVGFALLAVFDEQGIPQSVATVLAIAGSILASWISYRVVERPTQKIARGLLRRVRSAKGAKPGARKATSAPVPDAAPDLVHARSSGQPVGVGAAAKGDVASS